VDAEGLRASIHGRAGLSCVDCHKDLTGIKDFPHESPLKAVDCSLCHDQAAREFGPSVHALAGEASGGRLVVSCRDCHGTHDIKAGDDFDSPVFPLNLPATCEKCHLEKIDTARGPDFIRQYRESVHFKALEKSGLTMSANCGTCHGAHDTRKVSDPLSPVSRKNIIQTCGLCHVGIRHDYLEGVHGKDNVKGIKDVPVCTDCHSEHDILSPQDLRSKVYATKIAELCVRCHDNLALSRQYGFLSSRMKTYSETFHGTASKFGETRVANCASCHGFHDIRPSSDPQSSINPANLPQTCGKCHPGASRRFAEGQIHVIPGEITAAKYKSSHIIKNVYIVVIAAIISIMVIFIAADLVRRLIRTRKHG
jgi:predicted CXXCH cytochrome family protein